MKVIDILNSSDKTVFSFELLPPLRGQSAGKLYNTIDQLMEFDPKYINMTTHRADVYYKELEGGLIEKKYVRKRPSTVAVAAAIQNKYGVPVVPHIVCGGFTKEETENTLIDLGFLGIDNVLALRGDGLKGETIFKPENGGHSNASELITQISELKDGIYLDSDLKNRAKPDFSIGAAGYPEKHFESPNLDADMEYLKKKVDNGADYIVTQMFFDNQVYYRFVDKCRAAGIEVPIIPGIKPISLKNQLTVLPKIFSIDIPNDFAVELARCKSNDDAKIVGTEWAVQQAKELVSYGVPSLHLYTYGLGDNTKDILNKVF